MVAINTSSPTREGRLWFSRRPVTSCKDLLITSVGFTAIAAVVFIKLVSVPNIPPSLPLSTALLKAPTIAANTSVFWEQQEQCRYFLAESGIPRAGLGIYTAIDIEKGGITQSMPDICIYVADTPSGTSFKTHSWKHWVFGGTFEGGNPRGACEGVATLVNTMPDGVKTSYLKKLDAQTNGGGLERSKDPGAGAITQYDGISSVAVRDIRAGSEITIDYGTGEYRKEGKTYKASHRSVEWLRTYGMCIDHIEIKPATDRGMGRGAFARRPLKAGGLVAPAPLQVFTNRSAFAQQTPEALFVNYCFQPEGTNFMLYPYGPGVNLINHNRDDPNVEVRWSEHHMSHGQWLELPLDQLWEMAYPGGLILDIVAIRDVEEGEELFMDYGPEWERAWRQHAEQWNPLPGAGEYVYPANMDRNEKFRTVKEQEKNPYPKNLATVCPTQNKYDFRDVGKRMRWKRLPDEWPYFGTAYCNIIERKFNQVTREYEYEVSFNWDYLDPDKPDKKKDIDYGVPHSAIHFAEKPYTSDLHLSNSFRHPIGFPERLVPAQWRTTNQGA